MRKFIVGTDWWTDCDDAVAMRLLVRAHLKGEIEILCIGINACMGHSVSSLSNFLHFEGVENIPLGLDKAATDFGGNPPYQERLALSLTPSARSNNTVPDAAELYIKTLKEAEGKVEIIEVGYPQVLAEALKREPELFKQKVSKVWVMAGKWDDDPGKENNFIRNDRSRVAGAYLCDNCPAPITFLGWEIGHSVLVGGKLDANDQLYKTLCDTGHPKGRSAWDPMLVHIAIVGDEKKAGYSIFRGTAKVDPTSGENYFTICDEGMHCYVVKDHCDDYYKDLLDDLIK
ncbi:MAG: nucleoside hydrolase [Clostridia bacterium]|nr:nucleoside hydrolase [Clostridia bacterium]